MREFIRQLGQTCSHIRQRIHVLLGRNVISDPIQEAEDNLPIPDNACIAYVRDVIEQLLAKKKLTYGEVNFVIIDDASCHYKSDEDSDKELVEKSENVSEERQLDADEEEQVYTEEIEAIANYQTSIWMQQKREHLDEQLDTVLALLTPGLNHLQIRTDRQSYFTDFCQNMFEENGLVVQVEGKEKTSFPHKCMVLDMETEGAMMTELLREDIIYLPIYKKPWQIAPNLDITVPIGYNTVIVKGVIKQNQTLHSDKFEREFYDSL